MKQVVIKKGSPVVVDAPAPQALEGFLLVELRASCVSPGTEMAGIAASGQSLLQRAMAKPEKVKMAWDQMRREGFTSVWQKVRQTVDREGICGYSAAGVVVETGPGVEGFTRGMRVAVAGAGMANHAELVAVPVNLAVPIPDGADDAAASSVALGGIAMQGVRRAEISLGERVAVIGCGALGLLAVQMLRAAGCRVLVTDLDDRRLDLARQLGAEITANPGSEDIVKRALHWADGHGVDAALVFASTSSGEPVSQAFRMSRRKGRVVLVGVAGGEYKREDMYAKELDFVISTSYGPGRYDDDYELRGRDYPYGYVRWTEKRNMEAYLDLIADGSVKLAQMITVRETIEQAGKAYEALKSPDRPLLAVLEYGGEESTAVAGIGNAGRVAAKWNPPGAGEPMNLALVGTGSFVQAMHVPNLQAMAGKVRVSWACSLEGVSARACAAGLDGCRPSTDFHDALNDPAVHAVLVGTRHDTHAELAIEALEAGKAVFVEKPMCLDPAGFERLRQAVEASEAPYMVGYNRRFSPFAEMIRKEAADRVHPLMIQYTMNAGYLPPEHWTQGPEGGGRLLGEGCHIIDLFRSLVGHPVVEVSCSPLRATSPAVFPTDNLSLTLSYADGSVANLIYTALGHSGMHKEMMRVFFDEKAFDLDDYQTMRAHGMRGNGVELKRQDKGHAREMEAFHAAVVGGGRFPIAWEELLETWSVSWQANQICVTGDDAESAR